VLVAALKDFQRQAQERASWHSVALQRVVARNPMSMDERFLWIRNSLEVLDYFQDAAYDILM
jgi:hypothetical protein